MNAEEVCREVYAETRAFYQSKREQLGAAAHGFRVLYGPPLVGAPIVFVGYQPGGDLSHSKQGEHVGWPAESAYATRNANVSPFWRHVQATWPADVLASSTGLNAIFFRSPDVRQWQSINRVLRREIEAFCLARAERIVTALAPRRVVAIGTGTFDRLTEGRGEVSLRSATGRILAKAGTLWGAPAIGVLHLSGARISSIDRALIASYVRAV